MSRIGRNSIIDSLENLSNFCMLFFRITFYAIYNIKGKGGARHGILGKAVKVWESERYIRVWK